ncbi:helix-turn-helix domain-containing protein [Polaribacter sp.]|uniref:helix-turn-helix domain-containing protein n=1 Tax=Polaribacter sp. TaxID=1920175 RepID=UPI003F6B6584
MEGVSVITLISIVYFSLCILLAFFLLSVKSKNRISNPLFATFLLLTAIDISAYFHNLFLDGFANIVMAKSLFAYLQMPVLYFYVLSVCYSNFKLKRKHLLHFIPFVIGNLVLVNRFYTKDATYISNLWQDFNAIWELKFIHFSIHLQFVVYIVLMFMVLNKYQAIYRQNFSDNASKTYEWLFQFTVVSAVVHSFVILKSILKYIDNDVSFPIAQIVVSVIGLSVVVWLVFKALKHPDLFKSVDSETEIIEKNTPKDSNIDKEKIENVISLMKTEKPYLNPSLSIRNLASELKMNSRELSVLINQHLNQHFFDFVNEYRIEEAKSILKNPAKKEFTVLEVLYEVGFNSKSSFNTAFKKHTGTTPTQFRKTA